LTRRKRQPLTTPEKPAPEAEASVRIGPESDVALLGGPTKDGRGLAVLRAKNGQLQAGVVRPLEPGKPIVGEVVSLKPRKSLPILCDVETHLAAPQPSASEASNEDSGRARPEPQAREGRSGPPQVASEAYRQNWDVIYSRSKKDPKLLN
jgi:hypothetical protein